MDSQSPSNIQHQKVQLVAQQIFRAINQPTTQNQSNIIIFMSKLYKNNSPNKNKKMKSIRLNRFINLLEHIVNQFPREKQNAQILYLCILSTLLNDKNFYDQEDYELVYAMGVQISKVIEKLSQSEFGYWAVKLLSHLILNESINLNVELNEFEEKLKQSTYYQSINLDNKQQSVNIFLSQHQGYILQQLSISQIILDNISIQKVYSKLFKSSQNKSQIINLFYEHINNKRSSYSNSSINSQNQKSRKQLFIDSFIESSSSLTKQQVQSILKILQRKIFDRQSINIIISKISREKMKIQDLMQIQFKKIKGIEEVFIQNLIQQSNKNEINKIIQIFINMKNENNYFPMYLILKLNKKIPIQYVNLFFQDDKPFSLRRAIIFVLSIIDNQNKSFDSLLKLFAVWNISQKIRSRKQYQIILKSIHLSLQNVSKANILSQILKLINNTNKQSLNSQSLLQFVSYNTLKISSHEQISPLLSQTNRQSLHLLFKTLSQFDKMTNIKSYNMHKSQFLTNKLQPSNKQSPSLIKKQSTQQRQLKLLQLQHKCRLDLQFILNTNPYVQQQIMNSVKQLNNLLDSKNASIDQLIKQLPNFKQNLLQVILMFINNKYQTFYSQEVFTNSIDWALKTYKKYINQLYTELKGLLQKQKLDHYYKLIKTLIQYTIEKQSPLKFNHQNSTKQNPQLFTPLIKELINSSTSKSQRMNSNSFNDYFLTQSKWKHFITYQQKSVQKTYKKIIWYKTLIIQLKQLIKNMIKAQKTATKKQIKNITAQNVSDVLAFKAIHQYFDCQIEQGKQILIQIFRNIQPDLEFFDKTQALASSLSIQFYSIFDELQNLLQDFTCDTLIFLSKLITNQKPTNTQQKNKKKNKKKNQKQKQTQQSISITKIRQNFNLLFNDPNSIQSYKSLFMILRKLVQLDKIDKNELQVNLNEWLLKINFISCNNYDSWKNKVLSLSKMWKNASQLLADKKIQKKFKPNVLQNHFNIFTNLLNKLYQNFKSQPDFLQLQQRILLSLTLIYKKQDFSDLIEQQHDMIDFIIKKFQQSNISKIVLQNKFYYCYQCKKQACYACSSFLHRNHDKIYLNKTGICQHQNVKPKKQLKNQVNTIFGGVSAILKKNQDLSQQLLQRISQKILLQQQLRANQEGEYLGRLNSPNIQQLLQGRIPKSKMQRSEQIKRKIRQKQMQLKNQNFKQDKKQNLNVNNQKAITPQSEQYFQYKEPYCKQFKKIHSQLNPIIPKLNVTPSKINITPLARVFLRQLQNQHFHYQQKSNKQNQKLNLQGALLQQIKQKYLFFRNNNLKAENRDYTYGRGRGGYGGFAYGSNPRDNLNKRSIIACNKKHIFIPSSLSMMNLSMTKIKEKLQRKIQNKQYGIQQQQKNYVTTPPINLPFDVVETSLSQSSTYPTLAVIGANQLCFYPINADGRFGRQINTQFHRMDNILKFTWINDKKNLFGIAYNNYVRIGGVSPSNNIKTFAKAQVGKNIRDFDGYMNSKVYMLFIVDNDGKLFFIEVDFKDGKHNYSPADKLITLLDQNGKPLSNDIFSVKYIDGNRLLLSCQNGTIRTVQINRQSTQWKTKTFDLKRTLKSDSPIVLQALKLIKVQDDCVYIGGIGRRIKTFENKNFRRCYGTLLLIKIHQNSNQSAVYYTKEQNIQSYDFTFTTSGTLTFICANQQGVISLFKHIIDLQPQQLVEKITPNTDNNSIKAFCKKLISNNVFFRIQDGAMLKNLQFKQNKQLTGNFTANTKQKEQIIIKQLYPTCTHLVSGISFEIQLPSSLTQYTGQQNTKDQQCLCVIKLKFMDSSYKFYCNSKKREIQIPLNIKQTVQLFAHQNQMKMSYTVQINQQIVQKQKLTQKQIQQFVKIKSIHIYGFEARDFSSHSGQESNSIYIKAFKQLYYNWCIYQQYQKQSFQQYLLNYYRVDFHNVDMKRLYKLKYDNANQGNGFKMDQINLFLKLQLFSQSILQSLSNEKATKQQIEQYIKQIKKELLSKEYKRKSIQNSVYRLVESACSVYQNKTPLSVGHPYHRQSLINIHNFVVLYKKWMHKKSIGTFDNLCTMLSNLIISQVIDLDLILQAYPQLIIQLSTSFKKLISQFKHKQYSSEDHQISITKICSKYISILCQYYQLLKNKHLQNTQQKLLYLLQQVFGHTKTDMPKQLIMNPFLYLQSILNLNQFTQIDTSIQLFKTIQINSNQFNESFFDLQKSQKQKKVKKQPQSTQIKQQQQPLIPNINNNYENIIQQQKQMDEEQKQMYMEIQQDYDDDQQIMALEDVQALQLQLPKQSIQKRNQFNNQISQLSTLQKNLNQTITNQLLSQALPHLKKTTVYHYDFPLQLAIALFRRQNYLNSTNIYFYLGLLYNLLKIIQNNLKIRINKSKILQFIETVDKRIQNAEYSSLFIVLNFFISPKYVKTLSGIVIKKPQSLLAQNFANYYSKNLNRFGHLLMSYHPSILSQVAKLSDIMRFNLFELKNQLYNLRIISNIYLSYRLFGYNFNKPEQKNRIKQELLFKLVKYKIPVLKNIMLYEKWQGQLDRAKVLVSFQILNDNKKNIYQKQQGINMLYKCAKQTPTKYIEELIQDESKVNFLQEFTITQSQTNQNIQKKIFQLLQIYYNS